MTRGMKDSGIGWIGIIPQDWHVSPLKSHIEWKSIKNHENDQVLSLYRDYGVIPKDSRDDNYNVTSLDTSSYKYVEAGDLVVNKMKAWQGSVAVSDYTGIVSPAYHVCRITDINICSRYLHYLLRNQSYLPEYTRLSTGMRVGQWDLGFDDFKNLPIVLPRLEEQRLIASFLDKQCAIIDNFIEKNCASIEEYKKLKQAIITEAVTKGIRKDRSMKDSGIEWVGEIPEDWSTPKMGMVCEVITDYVASGSFASLAENVEYLDEPDYAMLIRTADVSNKGFNSKPVYINRHAYEFLQNSNLFGGELMFPNIGASVGDVYIVPVLYEKMSLAPNAIMVKTHHVDKFFYYYYQSTPGRLSIEDIAQSTAQAKFNKTDFRQLRIPLPSDKEQIEIVNYLEDIVGRIDIIIRNKENLLLELECYKKSMIYEYVTGKKEVKA